MCPGARGDVGLLALADDRAPTPVEVRPAAGQDLAVCGPLPHLSLKYARPTPSRAAATESESSKSATTTDSGAAPTRVRSASCRTIARSGTPCSESSLTSAERQMPELSYLYPQGLR